MAEDRNETTDERQGGAQPVDGQDEHLARRGREGRVHPAGDPEVRHERRRHGVPSQWSRSATSTPILPRPGATALCT